jgi:hypothetical protein
LTLLRYAEAIDHSLRILWAAPTDHEFTTSLAGFINYWSTAWAPYATYFHKQWVESSQAAEWALFGRPPGTRGGRAAKLRRMRMEEWEREGERGEKSNQEEEETNQPL